MKNKFENIQLDLIGINLDDVNPKIMDIIFKIIEEKNIKGKTYIGVANSLFELPVKFDKSEIVGDMIYSVRNLGMFKYFLENTKKNYKKLYNIQFENSITITIASTENFVMNTILFNTINDYFMLKIGYPKQKENQVDTTQICKRLKK